MSSVAEDPPLANEGEEVDREEEEEEFVDVPSSFQRDSDASIDETTGFADIQAAIDLMYRNRYSEAEALLKPWADVSIYHATARATIVFLQAVMSLEQGDIEQAVSTLNNAVTLCNAHRKVRGVLESISGWVFGLRLDDYSLADLQAEIFYAENNLLLSMLTFLQDENMMSFIKGGIRIRSCYSLYKQLYSWVETCERDGVSVDANFDAGVRMGMGAFNLFLSILPARVLRLLEFVGFSGNRALGLQELERGARSTTFRAPLCSSFLLGYHTVASVVLGIGDTSPDRAQALLQPQLDKYPDGVPFLYFRGRVDLMRGSVDEAMGWFERTLAAQTQWTQVHHLCWWELMWCYCFKGDWNSAASYADKLYKHSKWSKATFLYQKAAFLLMLRQEGPVPAENRGLVAPGVSTEEMTKMMRSIPPLKQRIAGKSLPVEKFAVSKSERYLQGARIPLSGMEMMYAWNGFVFLSQNQALLRELLKHVWKELMTIEESKDENPFYVDDWCVATLIQGVCFRALGRQDEAERCFQGILEKTEEVQHDHYAVAAASMELGLLHFEMGNVEEAERLLEATKSSYKGYHLESRLHFRIHGGQDKIRQYKAAAP